MIKPSSFLERGWGQGSMATDMHFQEVSPRSSRAKYFCITGAINAAKMPLGKQFELVRELELLLLRRMGERIDIASWNDNICQTQKEATVLLKLAENNTKFWSY